MPDAILEWDDCRNRAQLGVTSFYKMMRLQFAFVCLLALCCSLITDVSGTPCYVSNVLDATDTTPGTLRRAVKMAEAGSCDSIQVSPSLAGGRVFLKKELTYQSSQRFILEGNGVGVSIAPGKSFRRLFRVESSNGADIKDIEFDYADSTNTYRNDTENNGIVNIEGAYLQQVKLRNVTFKNGYYSGLSINHCVDVDISQCSFLSNNNSGVLAYGLENQTLQFKFSYCLVNDNLADGLQVRQEGSGYLYADVLNSNFNDNGHSSHGSAGNGGDAIEIEEFGSGGCDVDFISCTTVNTKAQAFDPSDNADGTLVTTIGACSSTLSGDDAFSPKELGDGDMSIVVSDCDFKYAKDDGINAKEHGAGDMTVNIYWTDVVMDDPNSSNDGDEGIQCYEYGSGKLEFGLKQYSKVTLPSTGSAKDGVKLKKLGAGDAFIDIDDSEVLGSLKKAVYLLVQGAGKSDCAFDDSDLGGKGFWQDSGSPAMTGISHIRVDSTSIGPIDVEGSSRPHPDYPGEVLEDNILDVDNSTHTWSVSPQPSFWIFIDGEEIDPATY